MRLGAVILAIFMVGSVFAETQVVPPSSLLSLSSAMNQRMLVMKDVAAYKAKNHQPVEDVAREQRVILLAKADALVLGLEPHSVETFIKVQMAIAKAIQSQYLSELTSHPEAIPVEIDLEAIRKIISFQDRAILNAISMELRSGGFSKQDKFELYHLLQAPHLTVTDKSRLVQALSAIKLNP